MCDVTECCAFFDRLVGCRNTIEVIRRDLCQGDYTCCARYVVYQALGEVPEYLLPTDHISAERIIKKAG